MWIPKCKRKTVGVGLRWRLRLRGGVALRSTSTLGARLALEPLLLDGVSLTRCQRLKISRANGSRVRTRSVTFADGRRLDLPRLVSRGCRRRSSNVPARCSSGSSSSSDSSRNSSLWARCHTCRVKSGKVKGGKEGESWRGACRSQRRCGPSEDDVAVAPLATNARARWYAAAASQCRRPHARVAA